MVYEINGKKRKIPDDEIEKNMKLLSLTREEAIQMWLEDEGELENEEQEALEQKARDNRIMATIHEAKSDKPRKTPKERAKKSNPDKLLIFQTIQNALAPIVGNIEVITDEKLIHFSYNGENYTVDLVKTAKTAQDLREKRLTRKK